MKRIRFGSALLSLMLALGFALASGPSSSAADGADNKPKCNCMYPNSGSYGVRSGSDCVVTDCWIELNQSE